jgi:DNA-binding NarL/FixJ family response regulator
MSPIRIFLADDHTLFIQALQNALNELEGFKVIATAGNGKEAIQLLSQYPCDLILLDVHMPVLDGISTARLIRERYPMIRILMLTVETSYIVVKKMLDIGVSGYILKDIELTHLIVVIHQVMKGHRYFSGYIIPEQPPLAPEHAFIDEKKSVLTKREKEIISLIVKGLTNNEISDLLHISLQTAQTHRKNIIRKTRSKNSIALIHYATENGLTN